MYSGTLRNVGGLSRRKLDGKRKPVILTFTASATWKVPAGIKIVDVFLVGGGGNGGAGCYGGTYMTGGGGGGGGGNVVHVPNFSVTPGANVTVVIGAAGGVSSFGALTAKQGANGIDATTSIMGAGGDGNSGGGAGTYYSSQGNGGVQADGTTTIPTTQGVGGKRLINNVGSVVLKDFNGLYYGNGGGGGVNGNGNPGTAGTGAGAGGAYGCAGNNGTSNSGGGGGGGSVEDILGTSYAGGTGGSGLVQIRYWKE